MPFEQHGSLLESLGFTGEMTDRSGLQYLRARYYSPSLGIFLSPDPVQGILGGSSIRWNAYIYAGANPVNYVDPSGEFVLLAALLVAGGWFLRGAGVDIAMQMVLEGRSLNEIDWRSAAISGGIDVITGGIGTYAKAAGYSARLINRLDYVADVGLSALADTVRGQDFGSALAGNALFGMGGRVAFHQAGRALRYAGRQLDRAGRGMDIDGRVRLGGSADHLPYQSVKPSLDMVSQETEKACGAACALQILQDKGIRWDKNDNILTQRSIRDMTDYTHLRGMSDTSLAKALTKLDWKSNGWVSEAGYPDPDLALKTLTSKGSWIAGIRLNDGSGHVVIVDQVKDGLVYLRDPNLVRQWAGLEGTIKIDDFIKAWQPDDFTAIHPRG